MILQEITALVILQNPPYFSIQCRWAPQSGLAKVSVQVLINNNIREIASHTKSLWFLSTNVRVQRNRRREKQGQCLINVSFFFSPRTLQEYFFLIIVDFHIIIWWFICYAELFSGLFLPVFPDGHFHSANCSHIISNCTYCTCDVKFDPHGKPKNFMVRV